MKKKKILNGTEFSSKSESATKSSSAPNGAATEVVELDDTSVAGGRYICRVSKWSGWSTPGNVVELLTPTSCDALSFASESEASCAASALEDLLGQDVSAQMIMDCLANAGLRPSNADAFVSFWGG